MCIPPAKCSPIGSSSPEDRRVPGDTIRSPPEAVVQKVFLYTEAYETGGYPPDSPFRTGRPGATRRLLAGMGLLSGEGVAERAPVPATRERLLAFHTPAYLAALARAGAGTLGGDGLEFGLPGGDCPLWPGMDRYLALAVGGSLTGAELLLAGEAAIAFSPMGGFHHAFPAHAAGFCYLNDVVLATQVLAAAGRRVAVLDVDVHHGDGTQHAFLRRADVLTVSIHQDGRTLFPGTGTVEEIGVGAGRGYSINLPMPPGTHDAAWLRALREAALPVIDAFRPDVIVCELGMDALKDDPLADLALTNNAYAAVMTELLARGRPLLITGGGGYHFDNTVRGWARCWNVLVGPAGGGGEDAALGMGGVMLENRDWAGGLRDHELVLDPARAAIIDAQVDAVVAAIRATVFPLHGL
jgi:acetoin utilization protein AcuC